MGKKGRKQSAFYPHLIARKLKEKMYLLIHRISRGITTRNGFITSFATVGCALLFTGCQENSPTETAYIREMNNGDAAALIGLAIAFAALFFESFFNRSHDDHYP